MAEELKSQSQEVTAGDPWQSGEGDPWKGSKKSSEDVAVSDSPVSDGGAEKVPTPLQTEEEKK